MGRCIVAIEIVFFNIFPVITFTIGQSEVPLLQNGIDAVPQGEGEAQALPIVRDARAAIFAKSFAFAVAMGSSLVCLSLGPIVTLGGAPTTSPGLFLPAAWR